MCTSIAQEARLIVEVSLCEPCYAKKASLAEIVVTAACIPLPILNGILFICLFACLPTCAPYVGAIRHVNTFCNYFLFFVLSLSASDLSVLLLCFLRQ